MIKIFEDFNEIHSICEKYDIINYRINPDGSVDVDGEVNLFKRSLNKIPLKFGRVSGDFSCSKNSLKTLGGCPSYVGGSFFCHGNTLTSLEGSPTHVGENFACDNNELISLEFSPSYVGGYFDCIYNKLTSLKGAPKEIGGDFFYHFKGDGKIKYLLPQALYDNHIDIKYILANQDDYGIWREDGSFNELRFKMMMDEKDI